MEQSHSTRHELIFCPVISIVMVLNARPKKIIGTNKLVYHIKMVNGMKKSKVVVYEVEMVLMICTRQES